MTTLLPLLLVLPLAAQRVAVPAAEEPAPERTTLTVAGRVTKDDARACNVAVRVGLEAAGEVVGSVETTSDDDGRFLVELEAPDEALAPGARQPLFAFARATEPGYQQREQRRLLTGDAKHAELGAVELHAGGTVVLRVVDAAGELLAARDVHVESFPGSPSRDASLTAWREARAERPTTFSRPGGPALIDVHLAPDTRVGLLVRARGIGTAWIEDVAAPSDGTAREVEMVVRGPATLEGVLMSPDGAPLRDVQLIAFPADLIGSASPELALYRERALREIAGGLVTDTTTTDADGRFAFRGLQPGAYFVQCARPNASAPIERHSLPTGLPARVVAQQHRLVVDVIAADGGTTSGVLSCTRLPASAEWRHFTRSESEPGERIHVVGTRRVELDVEPRERYAVAWNGDGRFVEREVAIEPSVWRTPVELRPAAAEPSARVSVLVRDPSGGPYELLQREELRLTITSAATGAVVLGRLASPHRSNEIELPAGDYVLAVESAHEPVMCGNGVTWPMLWRATDPVELRLAPGQQRELVVVPWIGGRVRLSLDVPDDVTDQRLRRMPPPDADWPAFIELWQDERFPHATVTANGSNESFSFFWIDDGTGTSAGPGGMLPGTTAVSVTLLRPGPSVLRVEVPGFEPAEVRLVARAGEIVDARVALREQK